MLLTSIPIHKIKLDAVSKKLSGKRDSDPRPQPWQGCALPTELFPQRDLVCCVCLCEEEETRTPTSQLTLPPQSSASTNSATSPLLLRLVQNSLLRGPSIQAFCYPSQWVGFDRANVLVSDCECKVTAKCRTSKTFPCFFSCFVVNFLKNGVVCDWFGN